MHARAWGPGAAWTLDGLPALLGAEDDDTGFVAHHEVVAQARRRLPGLRLGASRRVWDVLVGAVLEQKVTGVEARRSWRELCWRFGEPAPGPAGSSGDSGGCGCGCRRRRSRCGRSRTGSGTGPGWTPPGAGRCWPPRRWRTGWRRAVELRGTAGCELLRKVPGIGVWTAAEVAQRAWGDPDAVSVGDFHIPSVVGWALVGQPLDDAGMLVVLAPYAPQRQRAVRYLEAAGVRRPRFGPRYSPRDYRAILDERTALSCDRAVQTRR